MTLLKTLFLILIQGRNFMVPVLSTSASPYNGRTYLYRVNSTILDYVNAVDEVNLDSVVHCGIYCVSTPGCMAAFYGVEKMCTISGDAINNYYMSPKYQASLVVLGSVLYIDLEGWRSITSTTTTSTTTSTTTTTTTTAATTTPITTVTPIGGLNRGISLYLRDVRSDFVVGDRVKRGPDWSWGDQDGGGEGTISKVVGFAQGWTQVTWDNGATNDYRNGAEGKIDLERI